MKVKTLTKNWRDHAGQAQDTHIRKQNRNILTDTAFFLDEKGANVCEHTTKMAFLKGATRGLREEWMEGNLKGDYLRLNSNIFKGKNYYFNWISVCIALCARELSIIHLSTISRSEFLSFLICLFTYWQSYLGISLHKDIWLTVLSIQINVLGLHSIQELNYFHLFYVYYNT